MSGAGTGGPFRVMKLFCELTVRSCVPLSKSSSLTLHLKGVKFTACKLDLNNPDLLQSLSGKKLFSFYLSRFFGWSKTVRPRTRQAVEARVPSRAKEWDWPGASKGRRVTHRVIRTDAQ